MTGIGCRRGGRGAAAVLAAACSLAVGMALPSVAAASGGSSVYTVEVGKSGSSNGAPGYTAINGYFPHTVYVHAGESVRFQFARFHSVTFPVQGQEPPDLVQIDPLHQYTGFSDAAGAPFWFNGGPSFAIPADRWRRVGGVTSSSQESCSGVYSPSNPSVYDGSQYRGSGFDLDGESATPTYTLCFPKVGTYRYFCLIHRGRNDHGMAGQVVVVPPGTPIPSPSDQSSTGQAEANADFTLASQLDNYDPGGNTISLGHDQGDVALLRPFPFDKTVSAGSSVTFSLSSQTEVHMSAFGPTSYLDANKSKFMQFPDGTAALNPMVFFPSDPPPGGPRPPYTGSNHGNGWFTTGVANSETPDPTRPTTLGGPSIDVQFPNRGDFRYECLIHPGMAGTVHVR